jgi:hypothetical protein
VNGNRAKHKVFEVNVFKSHGSNFIRQLPGCQKMLGAVGQITIGVTRPGKEAA